MKIRRISQFQTRFSFPILDAHFEAHYNSFLQSNLGKIYVSIPWDELVKSLGLKEHSKGPTCHFSPRGKIALMFLKHYCAVSDSKLIEQLNGSLHYQMFCDLILDAGQRISNFKIVSQIRCEIAERLNIDELEMVLMEKWRPFMKNLESVTVDATCYESNIRYPTDVKLLWEATSWTYYELQKDCKFQRIRMPRTKFLKWLSKYVSYSKMKRKPKKRRRSITRGLLKLLAKLNKEITYIESNEGALKRTTNYGKRRLIITKILEQQSFKFYEEQTPKNAIVSIDKPYVRPIVRGKEIKKVEFGAKVNKLQIDGISFIEHLSFDAFNEGTRIQQTIYKAQLLTKKRTKVIGADAIYATNANRRFLTTSGIKTDFKPKGRRGKHHKHKCQLAKMITKERASRLEGSFGTDKEYFLLNRIKARNRKTEMLWIFFGIHTSNALNIGKRIAQRINKAA